jgi:4-oxalmesaconate hydratase
MIIDCHGHHTTAPRSLEACRDRQAALFPDAAQLEGDLFRDFPILRFVIPHGGGAVPHHWGRLRGLAKVLMRPPLEEHILRNVHFDTCVYHQPGVDLLARVIPTDHVLFASEIIGAVQGIDPETGHHFDDTRRCIDAVPGLSAEDRATIFETNARRVYPRLDRWLELHGVHPP